MEKEDSVAEHKPIRQHPLFSKFKEFPSIDNGKQNVVKKFSTELADEHTWVALEKVHGANFCFITDTKDLICARRTDVLDESETFYDWQKVRNKLKDNILELANEVKEKATNAEVIYIFGELFGGIYPHPDVKDIGAQPIQRGVYYCSWPEFYAYDILTVGSDNKNVWLNYRDAMKLFKKHNIFFATPLKEGTLSECMKFDIKINSTIPKLLGLPEIAKNIIEGVVVKSIDNITMPGSWDASRAIWKVKNAKFAEVNPPAPGIEIKKNTLYEKVRNEKIKAEEESYQQIERYITENRLHNVESKIGPLKEENIKEVNEMMIKDVMKDFCKDYQDLWSKIEGKVQQKIETNTASKVRTFISEYMRSQGAK